MSEYQGRTVLLAFSSQWCAGSADLRDQLWELNRRYNDEDLVIVQIDLTGSTDHLFDDDGETSVRWHVIPESPRFDGPVTVLYSGYFTPRSYLINSAGIIVGKDVPADAIVEEVADVLTKQ